MRSKKWTPDKQAEAGALRASGLSFQAIGEQLGVTGHTTIQAWLSDEYREKVNERHRENYRYNPGVRVAPFVYAIHFPAAELLKIGKSTRQSQFVIGSARRMMREKGLPYKDPALIWSMPGSEVAEAFMQVFLSLTYPQTMRNGIRISEWFSVSGVAPDDVILELNRIYQRMPKEMITP